jgi:hypothetical protein
MLSSTQRTGGRFASAEISESARNRTSVLDSQLEALAIDAAGCLPSLADIVGAAIAADPKSAPAAGAPGVINQALTRAMHRSNLAPAELAP